MKGNAYLFGIGILFAALLLAGCTKPIGPVVNPPWVPPSDSSELRSFQTWDEIASFLESANSGGYYGGYRNGMMLDMVKGMAVTAAPMAAETATGSTAQAADYSSTNIQVEGVDEADIVKNDGKYIYAIPGADGGYYGGGDAGKVVILGAYPASEMKIVSEIALGGNARAQEIFVYKDKLVVFGSEYREQAYPAEQTGGGQPQAANVVCAGCVRPPYYSQNFAFMKVYDISDREKPVLEKSIEANGNYLESRMIDGKVYAVFQESAYSGYPIPLYAVNGVEQEIAPSEVKYFDWPDGNYNYDVFVGLDLNDVKKEEARKIILMGNSQNIYVSKDSMYVTYTRYNSYSPVWRAYEETYGVFFDANTKEQIKKIDAMDVSDWRKDRLKTLEATKFLNAYVYNESVGGDLMTEAAKAVLQAQFEQKAQGIYESSQKETEKTVINKISLAGGFAYLGKGEVPGHVLNQFSMDEYNGYFRVATTVGQLSRSGTGTSNNLYVLDSNMNTVGKLEDLAPGESIYSARFMGNRAYLVTFKKVDPFFVIDLSEPNSPKLMGKLKIPGYSDYLHPYDETHIIGLGKGAVAAEEGNFAWYQGVKLSLFDVSDLSNPKEVAKYEIGDRGTDSYALKDHKAFLFSKSKNLLVIPITLARIDPSRYAGEVSPSMYGEFVFQGAYVFKVTPEEGFVLQGTVTHADPEELAKSGEYYWSNSNVKRSLYMDNYLYTVSGRYVKANYLDSLAPISSVQIGEATAAPVYYE